MGLQKTSRSKPGSHAGKASDAKRPPRAGDGALLERVWTLTLTKSAPKISADLVRGYCGWQSGPADGEGVAGFGEFIPGEAVHLRLRPPGNSRTS